MEHYSQSSLQSKEKASYTQDLTALKTTCAVLIDSSNFLAQAASLVYDYSEKKTLQRLSRERIKHVAQCINLLKIRSALPPIKDTTSTDLNALHKELLVLLSKSNQSMYKRVIEQEIEHAQKIKQAVLMANSSSLKNTLSDFTIELKSTITIMLNKLNTADEKESN